MASAESSLLNFLTSNANKYPLYRFLFIILLGFLVYCNTFNSPFSFDDALNLQNNPVITDFGFSRLKQVFASRRAVGVITFQLNYFFTGWSLPWFHLTNLLIHVSAALSAYLLLKLLMDTPYTRKSADNEFLQLPIPFFVALFFVVHPLQTQAVTYIVQRFTSLATLFYLISVVSYLKARLAQQCSGRVPQLKTMIWALGSLLSGILAFYTKETAYTLPVAIIMVEILFFRSSLRRVICIAVGGSALLTILLFKFAVSAGSINNAMSALDEATRMQTTISRSDYLITQFRVIVTYIRLIFLPLNQRIDYDYSLLKSFLDWRVFCSLGLITLLFGAAAWMIIKSRESRAGLRFIAFGILWFFLGLSVESSVFPIIDLVFEHRLYLPSVGAFTAISTVMLIATKGKTVAVKKSLFVGLLLLAVMFAAVAWKRNLVWRSEVALWEDSTSKSPNSARGWNNLAGAYIKEKLPQKSLKAAIRSIELDPSKADAWNNLGIAIDLFGVYSDRFNRTAEMFVDPRAVEGKAVNKWLGDVNNNLGLAYEIIGNPSKAVENYRNAIGYNPAMGIAYYNLGIISAATGDISRYAEQQQILRLVDPYLADRLQLRAGKR